VEVSDADHVPAAAFLSYMSTDTASSVLQSWGDIPGSLTSLCR
jgi:hypothetical protein